MSLWKIAWRSIQQRALASFLTGLSMALGVTLMVAILVAHSVIADSFQRNANLGYDMIVGAKGGKLQLVLNTVYHLSTPVENIPYTFLKEFTNGAYQPYVAKAIPYCLGDNYQGFRVVATVADLFEDTQGPKYEFSAGRNFQPERHFEGVVGALAANQAGLKVGDKFRPTHGVIDDQQGHEHEAFTVVGILKPTGTPNDRAIFINMEGFYLLEGHAKPESKTQENRGDHPHEKASGHDEHDHEHKEGSENHHDEHDHAPLPESQREFTAILIRTSTPTAPIFLTNQINEGNVAQAVLPIREIRSLFDVIVGPIRLFLLILTILIIIVSGIGILVSIYNSMSDRRREIAIMRALGARRGNVLTIILLESILLSLGGGLLGWFLGHALIGLLSPAIAAQTGVSLGFTPFVPAELALIPGLILLASLVGFVPALSAYRTDVARTLGAAH